MSVMSNTSTSHFMMPTRHFKLASKITNDITKTEKLSDFEQGTNKYLLIKKIIQVSSIDKTVGKGLVKILDINKRLPVFKTKQGQKDLENKRKKFNEWMGKDARRIFDGDKFRNFEKFSMEERLKLWLSEKAKAILDQEKLKQFEESISLMVQSEFDFEPILTVMKYFVLSPIELSYIVNIEKEILKSESLDQKIEEKKQQISEYQELKGEQWNSVSSTNENRGNLLKKIQAKENELEKAHQKLNSTLAGNDALREKINVLRKEKNVTEEIYNRLKKELEEKKQAIEETIRQAGTAYVNRNTAEGQLNNLQNEAKTIREKFETECSKLNQEIHHEKKFREFLKEKQGDKETLEKLEADIKHNNLIISQKMNANESIDKEYKQSQQKEDEIKQAFEKVKNETGIKEPEELLPLFEKLFEKSENMSVYVDEISKELESVEEKIKQVKEEIQIYNTKGASKDLQKRELKIKLSQQIMQEEKKKEILQQQYEKSIELMNSIKSYLINAYESLEMPEQLIKEVKEAAVTEENMLKYFGILEQKGLEAISDYAKLVAEQIKYEKFDQPDMNQQIENLQNIIEYENANLLNAYFSSQTNQNKDIDEGLLEKYDPKEVEPADSQDLSNPLKREQLMDIAMGLYNKKISMLKANPNSSVRNDSKKNQKKAMNKNNQI